MTAGSTDPPRCVWSSARPPRATSATTARVSGSDKSICNSLRDLRSRNPFRDGLEPLDGLGAEDEANVPGRDLVAPTDHRRSGDPRVVQQDPGGLSRFESERRDVEEE